MDYTDQAIIYATLLIPTFFALAVVGQGIEKITKHDASGPIVLGFGVVFLVMIVGAYFFFIR